MQFRQYGGIFFQREFIHQIVVLAADPADRAGVDQEPDAIGVGVHVGEQVAADLQRQGGNQPVAAPVGSAGYNELVASHDGGMVGQLVGSGDHVRQIAHADLVAAVTDADGRQAQAEQFVNTGGLGRDVAPPHVAVNAVGIG